MIKGTITQLTQNDNERIQIQVEFDKKSKTQG